MLLIVDDDPSIQFVLAAQLSHLRPARSFLKASDGAEAVELYQRSHVSLIMMDVQMPKMSGLEASKQIRELEIQAGKARCPIVAVTATPQQERCLKAGMDDFLLKPMLLDDLKSVLAKWLPGD